MTIRIPLEIGAGVLTDVLDPDLLFSAAGSVIFERGVDYAAGGDVTGLETTDAKATATVVGTRPYEVTIELDAAGLAFDCSCAMGEEQRFCKHLVAVGLQAVAVGEGGVDAGVVAAEPADPGPLRGWLEDQPAERLRDLLLEQAARYPDVHRRLSALAAAEEDGGSIDLSPYRAAIADAFSLGVFDDYGYVHYHDAWAWSQGVEAVIGELEELLAAGFGAETADLIGVVLGELNNSVEYVDDSDGHLYDLFERARSLHLAACHHACPDPVALAEQLFDWALRWDLDGFLGAVGDYAEVLGKEGLAAYRRLAEQRWRTVPALGPGDDSRAGTGDRFSITAIMESLAETTGGLEEMLEVMQRNLASGHSFVRIAQACRRYDHDDLALEWARRGVETFPDERRLAELVCDIHTDAGRHDEALATGRDLFAGRPSLERYQRLVTLAQAAGEWPAERESALATVRAGIEDRRRNLVPSRFGRWKADGSVLVEILLWENDADTAWEAAQTYGCDERIWLRLAALRGERRPGDALEVYGRHLDATLQIVNNRAYDQVVQFLKTMQPLYATLGSGDDFNTLVAEIRITYKRRRNLLARLDRAGL